MHAVADVPNVGGRGTLLLGVLGEQDQPGIRFGGQFHTAGGLRRSRTDQQVAPQKQALRDARLRGARLRDARLRGADLRNAALRDGDLRDADLRDAGAGGAAVTGETIEAEPRLKGHGGGRERKGDPGGGRQRQSPAEKPVAHRKRSARKVAIHARPPITAQGRSLLVVRDRQKRQGNAMGREESPRTNRAVGNPQRLRRPSRTDDVKPLFGP
ncbi:MAG: pentapeptide repeat-containing protein, partial [Thermogutta sp.]|nr:pentapeptide repeat-containing protein [Thermogutta sp.]